MVPVETPVEILADKLVSLPAVTSHIRHRDIWDIGFLVQTYNKEAKTISSEMIQKKRSKNTAFQISKKKTVESN
ncbi:nucleotidyl transferase AbiEii/AbiGii toxin family protein [Jhaorihella thermophila]